MESCRFFPEINAGSLRIIENGMGPDLGYLGWLVDQGVSHGDSPEVDGPWFNILSKLSDVDRVVRFNQIQTLSSCRGFFS